LCLSAKGVEYNISTKTARISKVSNATNAETVVFDLFGLQICQEEIISAAL
jgi:hypothetical protein